VEFTLGDKQPFWSRPLQHHNFVVPLQLPTDSSAEIYLQVRSTSSIQVPITLWDEQAFHTLQIAPTIMHGIYYGGLLIIALYNLLIYFVLGERAYLYYVSYIISMALFVGGLHGWSFMFLWPNATHWNDQSILLFLAASILFGVLFTRRFLASERPFQSWANWSFYLLLLICIGAMAATFLTTYTHVILVLVPAGIAACLLGLVVGIVACFERRASAPYYALAWTMLFLGGIIIALNKANILPSITREFAIKAAANIGLQVVEKSLTPQRASAADELFIASTTRDVMAVVTFDDKRIGKGDPGPRTRQLMQEFRTFTHDVS